MDSTEARAIFLLSGAVEINGQFYETVPGTGCLNCAFQVPGSGKCAEARRRIINVIQLRVPCFEISGWQLKKNE